MPLREHNRELINKLREEQVQHDRLKAKEIELNVVLEEKNGLVRKMKKKVEEETEKAIDKVIVTINLSNKFFFISKYFFNLTLIISHTVQKISLF